MADLVVRGMDMPTNVDDCPLNTFGYCNLAQDSDHAFCIGDSRPKWCPLVPLPEGHGRLIDADAMLSKYVTDAQGLDGIYDTTDLPEMLSYMPTIVPAEGGGTENEHV